MNDPNIPVQPKACTMQKWFRKKPPPALQLPPHSSRACFLLVILKLRQSLSERTSVEGLQMVFWMFTKTSIKWAKLRAAVCATKVRFLLSRLLHSPEDSRFISQLTLPLFNFLSPAYSFNIAKKWLFFFCRTSYHIPPMGIDG